MTDKEYLLEKFPGKGGWTFAKIPEILQDKHAPFGWVRVRGTIDGFAISHYHLMPMGNGSLFLPVKAEIRKKIKKQAGDWVHVTLYADTLPTGMPEELEQCFGDEPGIMETFLSYPEQEQQSVITWIYAAKTEDIKIDRITQVMDNIAKGKRPK